ncbi:putative DnaJ subfamily B member 8 [Monoraphidium neglectum]|uniref:Putative DnaJ subfamily B member 8 n=1 Tax=Monoraphidium neglectum TaxID=145388 RepID=A0A0D2KBH5_9CHLO|nr:putative DnaJ subfamily B member 8 [Monoraphidium neglectum]KIY93303.1 putative DnaJ subfamily B member 8 [Monoraphidium neglectum]|eukprot:XP_013892323.1 putative DnaJ subfamily B member 8 [Monoraphidium neglectum]
MSCWARIQIKKSEEELNRGFGGAALPKPPAAAAAPPPPKPKPAAAAADGDGSGADSGDDEDAAAAGPARPMTTIMLFGDAKAIEIAMRMIDEAQGNKEQKAKQRAKEYERKKDQKRRDRQLYHLRHARDYEELGVPIGASKLDVKKAYRKLAVQWHPDKHPNNPEEAKAKFQAISAAYNSLMASSEDDRVEQLEAK